ncbi:ATP-dependent helicase [Nocardioides sp.]|uniref:ATP-dependent helicase n=1 Tax=Nocardioides sp. TaxID=35761 RepID=UPI0039E5EF93
MPTYRLLPPAAPPVPPVLDEHQQRVVDHAGGPLLVLAGPGTGKTTTMVEAIVDRIERRGARPDSVLALTFSRKAAEQLRDRVTARLGRTTGASPSMTFHSFAYGLVRRYAPAELYAAPLKLLSAAEQDVVLAELLTDAPESVRWPERLRAAVGTRGFAREVAGVLARARERGLDPDQLVELGRRERAPELEAAGHFLAQYLDVLGDQAAIDYADLVARAVIEAERHRDELRAAYSCVLVDEYQDTDPAQVALLQALAGDGRDLVVVGDPDQSIYGFRGADLRGILDFPTQFRTAAGDPAPVLALGTTRRFGHALLAASRRVARGIPLTGAIPADAYDAFRTPEVAAGTPDGEVGVLTFDTPRAEVEHIADLLRRGHLEGGLGWGEMAVLVRSGRNSIPALRRSLMAAGVPVEIAADETPLAQEPAVRVLLDALSVAVDAEIESGDHLDYVTGDRARELLTSPLGGLDVTDVRALIRHLRGVHPEARSRDLLRTALLDPDALAHVEGEPARRAARLARLVAAAREAIAAGASAEEVLWGLWSGSGWPDRLRTAAESGGPAARLAHRDLDAIVALFEAAAKAEEQRAKTSPQTFRKQLEAQQIPADTLAEKGVRGEAVRLLTAHRAKGLEWRLVVVAHVQEGSWPDLRRRGSLLGPDRIPPGGRGELLPPLGRAAMLAEERRLFYVAVTRARERLIVTAVRSAEEDGEQPSRFLDELDPTADEDALAARHRVGRPARSLSLPGLVAELRRVVADPAQPAQRRNAAALRLRRLASVVPAADPATWWGLHASSVAIEPIRPAEEPVRMSASALQSILECPVKWFLEREAGGERPSTSSQGFGTIVHALAERVASGELGEASVADLMELVDEVWDRMEWRTPWAAQRGRDDVRAVLERFLNWHRRAEARLVVQQEANLDVEVDLPDGQRVRLYGFADRLELDADGKVVVVDLKTGKYAPRDKDLHLNPQLGLYQLAVDHGAAKEWAGEAGSGGAELIQLRMGSGGLPKVQAQAPATDDAPLAVVEQLGDAVRAVRGETFVARPDDQTCRFCSFKPVCPAWSPGSVLS